jgi:hypothetical protein
MNLHEITTRIPDALRPTPSPELDELLLELERSGRTLEQVVEHLEHAIATARRPPSRPGFTVAVLRQLAELPVLADAYMIDGQLVRVGDQAPLGPWTCLAVHRFEQAGDQPAGVCNCELPAMNRHHDAYLARYQTRGRNIEPTSITLHAGRGGRPTSVDELRAVVRDMLEELGRGPLRYVDPAQVADSEWTTELLDELVCSCEDMTTSLALSALGHPIPSHLLNGCELHAVWMRYAQAAEAAA